jgi:hypothetical protein
MSKEIGLDFDAEPSWDEGCGCAIPLAFKFCVAINWGDFRAIEEMNQGFAFNFSFPRANFPKWKCLL